MLFIFINSFQQKLLFFHSLKRVWNYSETEKNNLKLKIDQSLYNIIQFYLPKSTTDFFNFANIYMIYLTRYCKKKLYLIEIITFPKEILEPRKLIKL